jgi:ATP-binding cassette subfamily B protein RaxB
MQVMLGVFEPSRGRVCIGGMDLASIGPKRLRTLVGTGIAGRRSVCRYDRREYLVFDETADLEWVKQCAVMAAVDEEVSAMPMGYHTFIGDMGSVLSGGRNSVFCWHARCTSGRPVDAG